MPTAATASDATVQAIADLLPLLATSEDAAIVAFQRLSSATAIDRASAKALAAIEAEERIHLDLVEALAKTLPRAGHERTARRLARQFHARIGTSDVIAQLAVVAAVDSGMCTILSRLLDTRRPLASFAAAAGTLRRIHRDESGHVTVSRSLAIQSGNLGPLREHAALARSEMGDLIGHFGPCFEQLEVDTDRLVCDLRQVPRGLFA